MSGFLCGVMLLGALAPAVGPPTLPLVEETDWTLLRAHGQALLRALGQLEAGLPAETERQLRALLESEASADPQAAAAAVQKLLDAHCLLGVNINPESRVKAVRGPAASELRADRDTIVLIKVHNEAGVTQALAVSGPQLWEEGKPPDGRWLQVAVVAPEPLRRKLSGQRVEYVLLRLRPHEAGKREATLKFDVGQGTQDLGFRAEVPILFTVQTAKKQ